jgi:rfaE bifunctional protein nucleotidyltransferase chain/domain
MIINPRTIVLCHGVWDLLHLGHIRHLQEAAKFGDWLVVSVVSDRFVKKGMGRPHFNAEQRAESVRALGCVDEVIVNDEEGAWDLIRRLRPNFYVKGVDYAGSTNPGLAKEREAIAEVGGKMKITGSHKWSSSRILKGETFSEDVCQYLDFMKNIGARDKILEAFDRADRLKVLFVGEIILDVYRYVQGLGRASKELMLATVETGSDAFEGGVLAAMKHGEWKNVDYLSHPRSTGISKTRFVDSDFNRKLFDVYSSREIEMTEDCRAAFRDKLGSVVATADVVVVNDFGHGLLGDIERYQLRGSRFLAVNSQTNAGNYGFNLVTKYPKVDYICIDEPEARLASGMPASECVPSFVVSSLSHKIDCRKWLITHGRYGSQWFDMTTSPAQSNWKHETAPALAIGGIDTMGAGDAVMAVTAPLVAAGLDLACAALVGNIVGAIKVSILGHKRHVGRDEILQTLEALLA